MGRLEVFSIGESEFAMAEFPVERYAFESRLRALDALQLAVALELRNQKLVDHFVAADAILCEVARLGSRLYSGGTHIIHASRRTHTSRSLRQLVDRG